MAALALIANGCERLPAVADGCGQKSSVKRARLRPQTRILRCVHPRKSHRRLHWLNFVSKITKSFNPTSNVFRIHLLHTHGVHWRAPRRRHHRFCPCLATLDESLALDAYQDSIVNSYQFMHYKFLQCLSMSIQGNLPSIAGLQLWQQDIILSPGTSKVQPPT